MKKYLQSFLLIIFLFLISSLNTFADNNNGNTRYILIVNCHLESINWDNNVEDEIIRFASKDDNLDVFVEHIKTLDIKNMDDLNAERHRLTAKYVNRPSVIVFIGPAPFKLFASAFQEKWHDVPMLSFGPKKHDMSVENIIMQKMSPADKAVLTDAKAMQRDYNITGIFTNFYIKETIDLMTKTIKGMNHLVWICDNRQASMVARVQAQKIVDKYYPNLTTEFLNSGNISTETLIKKVSSYDNRTGILFHTWYKEGNVSEEYYVSNNLYKVIGNYSSTPVFSIMDMNTEHGYIAGGHFVQLKEQSEMAIKLLKRVLSGERASSIPFVHLKNHKNYLNYLNLENYHSDNILHPDDVIYFQSPENFLYKYRFAIIILSMICLIILLYIFIRMKALQRIQKIQKEEMAVQSKMKKEIEIRNIKLALSLEVSNVKPWMLDIETGTIKFDDVKSIIEDIHDDRDCMKFEANSINDFVVDEDKQKVKDMIKSLADGRLPYVKDDVRMKLNADGEIGWYTLQATVYERNELNKPTTLMGTLLEITDIKNNELQLKQAKNKAEESDRLKSAFIANMSHEIRTPLNAIVGFSGMIAQTAANNQTHELASIIQYNNSLLLKLVDNIMNLSKIESDVVKIENTNVDINSFIDKMMASYRENNQYDLDLRCDHSETSCVAVTDSGLLEMIVDNLLSNAMKFTKHGSVTLGYEKPRDGILRFYVRDTGCGVAKDDQKVIFGKFIKLDKFERGTGLGLTLCEEVLKKMGGTIGVFSEKDHGAEFWFEIPYIKGIISADDEAGKAEHTPHKILVAEDDESSFIILRSMLGKTYKLIHAWNGQDAVDMFKKYQPDLILMDVRMPVMDGFSATVEIRKLSQSVPIIAITAFSFNDEKSVMEEKGFNGYQSKPLNRKSLKDNILSMLDKNKK